MIPIHKVFNDAIANFFLYLLLFDLFVLKTEITFYSLDRTGI